MPRKSTAPDAVNARIDAIVAWAVDHGTSKGSAVVYASVLRRFLTCAHARGALDNPTPADVEEALKSDTKAFSLARIGPAAWRVYRDFALATGLPVPAELPKQPRRQAALPLSDDDRLVAERLRELQRKGLSVAYILENSRWTEAGFMTWPGQQASGTLPGTWPDDKVPQNVLEVVLRTRAGLPEQPPICLSLRFDNERDVAFLRVVARRAFPEVAQGARFGFEVVAARDRANRLEKNWLWRKANGKRLTPREAQALIDRLGTAEAAEAAAAAAARQGAMVAAGYSPVEAVAEKPLTVADAEVAASLPPEPQP